MALSLEGKKAVVAEVAEMARGAHSVIAAEYRGLSVGEMTALRVKARESAVRVRVVRNTLARRALQDTEFECMSERLIGPLVLAFSKEEPASAARVMRDFSKDNQKLVIKLAAFGGQVIDGSDIDVLANLPTREEALVAAVVGASRAGEQARAHSRRTSGPRGPHTGGSARPA